MNRYIAIECNDANEYSKIQDFFIARGYIWIGNVSIKFRQEYGDYKILLYDNKVKMIAIYAGKIPKIPYSRNTYSIEKQISYKQFMRKVKFEKING